MPDADPFAPLSAKPKDAAVRRRRRISEAASAGGKAHRGGGRKTWRLVFGKNGAKRKQK